MNLLNSTVRLLNPMCVGGTDDWGHVGKIKPEIKKRKTSSIFRFKCLVDTDVLVKLHGEAVEPNVGGTDDWGHV